MAGASLQAQVQPVAKSAFIATFQGYADKAGIADLFANRFAPDFATAVAEYFAMCIGLPPGGPIQAASPTKLEQDIANAGKNAFKETFQGYDDKYDIATKFGNGLKPIAAAIASWVPLNMTTPAAPPAIPVSPGGPIIWSSSTQIVPVTFSASRTAWQNTFLDDKGMPGVSDTYNISTIFATIFQQVGEFIGIYMSTCQSLPGGGPLQTP